VLAAASDDNMTTRFAAFILLMAPFAGATTINFLGTPTGVNDGIYYVLPYQLAIDGVTQNVVCYDFLDDVSIGDTWQANILSLAGAASSGFFPTSTLATYERVAWLAAQTYTSAAEQVGLQHAIWNVFGSVAETAESLFYEQAADSAAATGYAGVDFSGFRFIQEAGAVSGGSNTEQAFVYQAAGIPANGFASAIPEPETMTLFAAGILLLIAGKLPSNSVQK
jgi:hypothetical protein